VKARRTSARCLLPILTGSLLCQFAGAHGNASESDLLDRLESTELSQRRDAVRELGPDRIGKLQPGLAIEAVIVAAQDSDARIRESALAGLAVLSLTVRAATSNSAAAAFAREIQESRQVRPLLERILTTDQNSGVALAASTAFMSLYGSDPAAESLLLNRIDQESFPIDKVKLLGNLAIGGIDSDQSVERLAKYLRDAPAIVQHKAATLLLTRGELRVEWLEDYLRVIETPATFADPRLVRALARFSVGPEKYLPRLLGIRERLTIELDKPPDARTVTIHNDDFWRQTLDDAIAAARSQSKAPGEGQP